MAGLIPFNAKAGLRTNGFNDFYNALDDFFNDPWWPRRSLVNDTFKVDVQETEKEYLIEAELPGINKEELDLSLEDNRLAISVNREESNEKEDKNYIHRERRVSSMQRCIYLADAAAEEIKAQLDSGVLKITVPKSSPVINKTKINID